MSRLSLVRRIALGMVATLLALATTALAARASELSGRAVNTTGLRIVAPDVVLREYCEWRSGVPWLVLPGGLEYELVPRVDDPAIANRGDGRFHPYDPAEVERAFAAVRYPLAGVNANVYLLPLPRRGGVESAAAPGLILLSPGTRELSVEQQHAEAVHELGHVVQYQRLPDADVAGWSRYRVLRGIEDVSVFSSHAPHADRPHEIFAEDFRALFGGALANYSGSIENPELDPPATVIGLERFLLELADAAPSMRALGVWPNPARGDVAFARWGRAVTLDVFDLAGRRVASLAPRASGEQVEWRWDGRDGVGRAVVGVVFARPRDSSGASVRFTRLP